MNLPPRQGLARSGKKPTSGDQFRRRLARVTFAYAGRLMVGLLVMLCGRLGVSADEATTEQRPNIVWILSEDNSQHYLKLYETTGAATPRIAALAEQGMVFNHAFSCAPVCSVARTTLITSVYGPRLGTQFHRRLQPVQLPEGWLMVPAWLKQAGYYTSNNAKKDYNFVEPPDAWDESSNRASWRHRPDPAQPFFHMHTLAASHESSLHFTADQQDSEPTRRDPAHVTLLPYHPDTALFRFTTARYYDRIEQIDLLVGKVIDQLQEDGLLENTFVFYFGDHGGVLPRSKGYVYESGLHVPLVVRVPDRWRERVAGMIGSRRDEFVSFVDLGPTALALAGVAVPDYMDGSPIASLLPELPEPKSRDSRTESDGADEAFGYADRFDEKYDFSRSLRRGKWKYVRHYTPFYPESLQNNYRYNMLAYREWRQLFREGKLQDTQLQFFQEKQPEALYDLSRDPHEINNLANEPADRETLVELRERLQQRLREMPDLSFYPESEVIEHAVSHPIEFGRQHQAEIATYLAVADLQLQPFDDARDDLVAALHADDPWQRYWGLIVLSAFGEQARSASDEARRLLKDDEPLVRMRAAEFLARLGEDTRPVFYDVLEHAESPAVALLTLNSVVFLRDGPAQVQFDWSQVKRRTKNDEVQRRWKYLLGEEL
jgi:uncharacterized sulfatase